VSCVSILRLPVREGDEGEFVRRFAGLAIFEHARQSGGFQNGRLLRGAGDATQFVVLADWASPEDYRTWLDNPARTELGERLAPLLTGEVEGGELFVEVS
jgi:heme-degrading monooxygenase HmoA